MALYSSSPATFAKMETAPQTELIKPRSRTPRRNQPPNDVVLICGTSISRYDLVRIGNSPKIQMVITASNGRAGPRIKVCDIYGKQIKTLRGWRKFRQITPISDPTFPEDRRSVRAALLAAMNENSTTRQLLRRKLRNGFNGWIDKMVRQSLTSKKRDGTERKRNRPQFSEVVQRVIDTAEHTRGGLVTISCNTVRRNLVELIQEYTGGRSSTT